MKYEAQTIELPHAVVTRARPDLVEARMKPGATITVDGLHAVYAARKKLCGTAPHAMLFVATESVGFDMDTMHHEYIQGEDAVVAIAVVLHATVMEMLTKLYFTYFPQRFQTFATNDEAEARAWIEAQLASIKHTD